MAELSGFPYAEVQFGTDGQVLDGAERKSAIAMAKDLTDVLVISHGWNNDMSDARSVYTGLAASMKSVLGSNKPDGYADRDLGIIGVLWPSKKFAESDLIPGGAASVGGGAEAEDIRKELDELADFLDRPAATKKLKAAKELVDDLETDPKARKEFAELVRDALDDIQIDKEDASEEFFAEDGEELMDRLAKPVTVGRRQGGAATTGGAAGLGDFAKKAFRAARNMLNVSTYYEMKSRAGRVGETGVADLIADLHQAYPNLRIHLAGHSFGARVVTAAARAGDDVLPIASVSLLQAAFSHYSFADNWEADKDGTFRSVVLTHRIKGPMIITYTKNDKAVGVAYAIASRVAGQVAAAVGDKDDKYGGLGRNGAQKTPEAVAATLLAVGEAGYQFQPGKVHNLLADAFISGHGDVEGREVAYAVLTAIGTT